MSPTDRFAAADGPVGELDRYLLASGEHRYVHHFLGAHPVDSGPLGAGPGTWFTVWAPGASRVDLVGDFNRWEGGADLDAVGETGVWTTFVAGVGAGASYRFGVTDADGFRTERSDPVAAAAHLPPSTASIVADLGFEWSDDDWLDGRAERVDRRSPVSIYELHLGSWGRRYIAGKRWPTYAELADPVADHALAHGFTHVELLPVMEHPFYGSWGYQTTGYFAPTSRYGSPTDLMRFVDTLHRRGVGVILDWVPSHFPMDGHGLARFDGTHLYEHADPRQGYHPDWTSAIFNYGRNEVRAFLVSSAIAWLERYHVDGLRVDAVASMLYLDYSRPDGEWIPNRYGGRENLEAIEFLRQLNTAIAEEFPSVATFAEESTAWPGVTAPVADGGLGFAYKWDMGWMHDTLQYLGRDPVHRRHHHDEITFRGVYAYTESFVLPLSHDEVVHGKGSLLAKMPGDDWQRFANLRMLFGAMWGQPGKKLLFMGGELATGSEWDHESTLPWELHDHERNAGVRRLLADLNGVYRDLPALHTGDAADGFSWVVGDDDAHSVFAWLRHDADGTAPPVLVVVNATPTVHHGYRVGVPTSGSWAELINTDAGEYGGSGVGNDGAVTAEAQPWHGQQWSIALNLPPLAALFLQPTES